jgi:hypothetical protein
MTTLLRVTGAVATYLAIGALVVWVGPGLIELLWLILTETLSGLLQEVREIIAG